MKISVKSKGHIKINPEELLTLEDLNIQNEDFSNKKLRSLTSVNSRFENCKFDNLMVDDLCFGAGKSVSEYINCCFDKSTFASPVVGRAKFVNCSFRNVNIKQFFAHDAEFIGCTFSGKIKKALFYGRPAADRQKELGRDKNEIYDNDFSELDMDDVGFRWGVDLGKQKLPSSENYLYIENAEDFLRKFTKTTCVLEDDKLQKKLKIKIQIQEEKLVEGQKQILFIKKDMDPEIFELLKKISEE